MPNTGWVKPSDSFMHVSPNTSKSTDSPKSA